MQEHFWAALLAGAVVLAACSPSPDQTTATAVAAIAQTAAPTATLISVRESLAYE